MELRGKREKEAPVGADLFRVDASSNTNFRFAAHRLQRASSWLTRHGVSTSLYSRAR